MDNSKKTMLNIDNISDNRSDVCNSLINAWKKECTTFSFYEITAVRQINNLSRNKLEKVEECLYFHLNYKKVNSYLND